jgi:hypothetical protein
MSRSMFGGSEDDYAVDAAGNPAQLRRVHFYTSTARTTEITDLASDAAGTGSPLTVTTDSQGFWGPVYGPPGTTVMYAAAEDAKGGAPTRVVAIYPHTTVDPAGTYQPKIAKLSTDLIAGSIVSHRNSYLLYPENTIEGIKYAIATGARTIKIDVVKLLDGSFGVMHDTSVDRTTTGTGNANTFVAAAWKNLVIDSSAQGYTGVPNLTPPLLTEVLDAVGGTVCLLIEPKDGATVVAALVAEITRRGLQDTICITIDANTDTSWIATCKAAGISHRTAVLRRPVAGRHGRPSWRPAAAHRPRRSGQPAASTPATCSSPVAQLQRRGGAAVHVSCTGRSVRDRWLSQRRRPRAMPRPRRRHVVRDVHRRPTVRHARLATPGHMADRRNTARRRDARRPGHGGLRGPWRRRDTSALQRRSASPTGVRPAATYHDLRVRSPRRDRHDHQPPRRRLRVCAGRCALSVRQQAVLLQLQPAHRRHHADLSQHGGGRPQTASKRRGPACRKRATRRRRRSRPDRRSRSPCRSRQHRSSSPARTPAFR